MIRCLDLLVLLSQNIKRDQSLRAIFCGIFFQRLKHDHLASRERLRLDVLCPRATVRVVDREHNRQVGFGDLRVGE